MYTVIGELYTVLSRGIVAGIQRGRARRLIDDVGPPGDAIESGWRAFGAPVGLVCPNFRSDVFPHHRPGQQMAFGLTRGHTTGLKLGVKNRLVAPDARECFVAFWQR